MQSTARMEASTIYQPASSSIHILYSSSNILFFQELCSAVFLLDQFMRVLICLGALTQPIMSISVQSDPHYVKWCCYAIDDVSTNLLAFCEFSFLGILWFSKSSQQSWNVRKTSVCCCTAIHCRELPSHVFLKLYISLAAVRAATSSLEIQRSWVPPMHPPNVLVIVWNFNMLWG